MKMQRREKTLNPFNGRQICVVTAKPIASKYFYLIILLCVLGTKSNRQANTKGKQAFKTTEKKNKEKNINFPFDKSAYNSHKLNKSLESV